MKNFKKIKKQMIFLFVLAISASFFYTQFLPTAYAVNNPAFRFVGGSMRIKNNFFRIKAVDTATLAVTSVVITSQPTTTDATVGFTVNKSGTGQMYYQVWLKQSGSWAVVQAWASAGSGNVYNGTYTQSVTGVCQYYVEAGVVSGSPQHGEYSNEWTSGEVAVTGVTITTQPTAYNGTVKFRATRSPVAGEVYYRVWLKSTKYFDGVLTVVQDWTYLADSSTITSYNYWGGNNPPGLKPNTYQYYVEAGVVSGTSQAARYSTLISAR